MRHRAEYQAKLIYLDYTIDFGEADCSPINGLSREAIFLRRPMFFHFQQWLCASGSEIAREIARPSLDVSDKKAAIAETGFGGFFALTSISWRQVALPWESQKSDKASDTPRCTTGGTIPLCLCSPVPGG